MTTDPQPALIGLVVVASAIAIATCKFRVILLNESSCCVLIFPPYLHTLCRAEVSIDISRIRHGVHSCCGSGNPTLYHISASHFNSR